MQALTRMRISQNIRLLNAIFSKQQISSSPFSILAIRSGVNQHTNKTIYIQSTKAMSSCDTSPTYTVDYLSKKLISELEAQHVDMEDLSNCGCGMKFDAVIVSPKFEGKPVLQRQRLVNQILAEEMKHIHAFTMRTLTPDQWKDFQSKQRSN